ncbi:MAG TPA: hypothetical protein VGM84_05075 [Steroidobacteraceae bacterium]
MPPQDDERETQMINLFNLTTPPGRKRSDIDAQLAIDGKTINFELKSTTTDTVSTVRDFGPDHIAKWRNGIHWIFAFYDSDGKTLRYCVYASPTDMEPWIASMEAYIAPDIALTVTLPLSVTNETVVSVFGHAKTYSIGDARRLMKNQWKKDEYIKAQDVPGGYSLQRMTEIMQGRARYVIARGATLNNPHISSGFFMRFDRITGEHAARLRHLVHDYLNAAESDEAIP